METTVLYSKRVPNAGGLGILTLATYPTPAQTRCANSLGHFIRGAMTERGLHMSADGILGDSQDTGYRKRA